MELEKGGRATLSAVADVVSPEEFAEKLGRVENDQAEKQKQRNAAAHLRGRLEAGDLKYYRITSGIPPASYEKPGMDAVYVATPNNTHKDYTVHALQHGLHVICEKPLASSVSDACEMAREADNHESLVCAEAAHYIYKPTVMELLRIIKKAVGECGPIKYVDGRIVETLEYDSRVADGKVVYRNRLVDNILNWNKGGGITRDTGGHLLSILDVLDVSLELVDVDLYNYDDSVFTADTAMVAEFKAYGSSFEPGARITLKAAKFNGTKEKYMDILLGKNNKDRGTIHIDFDENEIVYTSHDGPQSWKFGESAHRRLLENFIESMEMKDGGRVLTPFRNAIGKIRKTENIYAMSERKHNGSLWGKNRLEFYSH